jgi:hypothetical protein
MATEDKGLMNILSEKCGIKEGSEDYNRLLANCLGNPDLKGVSILTGDVTSDSNIPKLISAFKDMATEDKGLMNILSEKCGIKEDSKDYNSLLANCLKNPDLKNVPILTADIPVDFINKTKNDDNTNPDPEFCNAVMDAKDSEEMANVFNTFFDEKSKETTDSNEKKYYEKQKDVLCSVSFGDINRGPVDLQIGDKKVTITGSKAFVPDGREEPVTYWTGSNWTDVFQSIFKEIKEQGELSDGEALDVMKQMLLGYRGQNGTGDGAMLVGAPLMVLTGSCSIRFDGVLVNMSFEKDSDHFKLTEKTEESPLAGFLIPSMGGQITSKCRFKFPNDKEIRTELPVVSTRKETSDGSIKWSCLFRENPPKKVIYYGGNKIPETTS